MGKALIFSGVTVLNPLETITISTPDEDVERIVTFFDTSISSEKESALKTLVTTLKNDGIWDKLTYLMLPVFASDEVEAAQNVLLPQKTESILNIDRWQFSNGVFTQISNNTVSLTNYILNASDMATQSLAVGAAFDLGELPSGVSSERIVLLNGAISIFKDGGNGFLSGGGTTSLTASSILSGSVDVDNSSYYVINGSETNATTKTLSSPSTSATPSIALGGSGTTYYNKFTGDLKLLWVSTMLTAEELASAHVAFKAFMDSLEGLS